MDIDEIDRTLARLHQAVAAISANLVELESDGVRTRLDQAGLAGTTATRWAEAKVALDRLWTWFSQLNDLVERAGQVRGKKGRVDGEHLSQLAAILATPWIEVSAGPPAVRCTPDDLLTRMTTAFGDVRAVISAAGQAWAAEEARLLALDTQLTQTATLASSLGTEHRAQLDRLRARLAKLGGTVSSDPLSVEPSDFDTVEVSLQSVSRDIEEMTSLRDGVTERFADAQALLDDLRGTVRAAADAHRLTTEKIANPQVPRPVSSDPNLQRHLDQATASAAAGDWRAARRLLDGWTQVAAQDLSEARRVLDAIRAPLEARNELRGRLDAYRAKAFHLGLLENHTMADIYQRAYQALYQAPTDLAEAIDLVNRYRQAMTAVARTEVPGEM